MEETMPALTKFVLIFCAAILAPLFYSSNARADSFGTRDEAHAMVDRAAAFLKANGRDPALAEFGNPKGQFIDRDLYIVTYAASDGTRLSHPYNLKLVGKSVAETKDFDGKAYGQEIMSVANGPGSGWIDYKFSDPVTKKLEDKSLYVLKVGDIIIGCGVYKH
jgi:cytochrome c